jgi:hypothetical protein
MTINVVVVGALSPFSAARGITMVNDIINQLAMNEVLR